MKPLYFGSCFGWLHPAAGARGVVLCSALGLEELVTHRFFRELATQLAAAGMPTLRFDYQGTGDSAGSDLDPARVASWKSSIHLAIDWMRQQTGVSQVALVGFRAGALLAADVASTRGDVDALALLAPPATGRAYLRELRALSALVAEASGATVVVSSNPDVVDIEVGGFPITLETSASLNALDVTKLERRPARKVLVLGRANAPGDQRIATRFRELGSDVTVDVLAGLAEMQWDASLAALPPHAFQTLVEWLSADVPAGSSSVPRSVSAELGGDRWCEEPIRFGTDSSLFGIRCEPIGVRRNQAILFLNHGANHHVGWARNFVQLSRRLAASGVSSLRIDVAGLGDSPATQVALENQLYSPESQQDVRAAINWLASQGYERVTVFGHCAGAHLAFHAAVNGAPILDLVLVNMVRFFWKPGDSLSTAMRSGFRSTEWYLTRTSDFRTWRRALRGEVNLLGISRVLWTRALGRLAGSVKDTFSIMFDAEDNRRKVRQWFRELSRRGTRVLLVFGAEDSALDEIALHAGPRASKLRKLPNFDVRILDNTDHNITSAHSYESYARMIEEHLGVEAV